MRLHEKYALEHHAIEGNRFTEAFQALNEKLWELFRDDAIGKEELRNTRFPTLFAQFNLFDDQLAAKVSDEYLQLCPTMPYLVDGAIEVLDYLLSRYHLHIITNGFADIAMTKLAHSGIADYFSVVMTPDAAGRKKPHKKIFDKALAKANTTAASSVFVGNDIIADIHGASEAGLDQVYYNPSNQKPPFQPTYEIQSLLQLKQLF